MVDITDKSETDRFAIATARVLMSPETARRIADGDVGKGDVLGIARVAAIQGLKRTSELIPLCHPIRVTAVDVDFAIRAQAQARVSIKVRVEAYDRTGVEMEALSAVSIAALTIYDMCKSMDRGMRIDEVRLEAKSGGKSGDWWRDLG
ncbi:MAG: cyclic pyranopterin monophosphate synthase MoaC [Deltaproteobacteria bacterium]|nr:cyclic pyranopterin monophosphate synthase MoaC [Deltaproteobacteria bacterium]